MKTRVSRSTAIIFTVFALLILSGPFVWAKPGNGNGGGNAGGGNGGDEEAVYLALDDSGLTATWIASTNLNFTDIIFRQAVLDLYAFPVEGVDCAVDDFGPTQGTMVIGPNPELAGPHDSEMRFWFRASLNGKNVEYLLKMYGSLVEGGWFPTDESVMTFDSWEIMASNRKAQKTGCYGSSFTDPLPVAGVSIFVVPEPVP